MTDTHDKNKPVQSRQAAELAIHQILAQYKIQILHSDACIAEAEHLQAHPGFDDAALTQWQTLPFVTIDNPDSRDLDQALLIETTEDNGYRVRYALADAAYYVPPGSELFTEAMRRGVTYYTPLLAAPMLPESLSSGLISLNPNVDRRALVFDILLDQTGAVLNTSIVRALIQSQGKLSYESVQAFLDADNAGLNHEYTASTYAPSLRLLRQVGEILIQRAHDRDVIPFNRSEAQIEITDYGITLVQRLRVRTEKYNEQISLLCNMQGAEMLKGLSQNNDQLQAIFRAHDAPLAGRLSSLRRLLTQVSELPGLGDQWRWKKDQSLADYVTSLPDDENTHGKLLAIERQILVSNQASEYRSEPGRHHALAASSYARFSSPMREIVGIFTHKELLEALGVVPSNFAVNTTSTQDDNALREEIITIANQSRQTQKQINKAVEFYALQSVLESDLSTNPRPQRDAIIMGFKRDRIYLACNDIAVDLKVTKSDIETQYKTTYEFGDLTGVPVSTDAPTWHLGDSVTVSTQGFNKETKRYQLNLHETNMHV